MSKISVSSQPLESIKSDALIVLHEAGGILGASDNATLSGHFAAFARAVDDKKSRKEWFCTLPPAAGVATGHLLLESATFDTKAPHDEPLKMAAARAVALCREHSIHRVAVAVHHELAADKARAILEGILLGDFQDTRFKADHEAKQKARPALEIVLVVDRAQVAAVEAAAQTAAIVCEAQNHVRELVNAPNNVLTPDAMAKYAKALAKKVGLECEVLDEKQLQKQGYELTWQVGRGSEHPPRMIVLRYTPKKAELKEHWVFVGKGMTFDTGGLSIKDKITMPWMNYDMAGAGAVLGTMEAIARLKVPVRVTAVICAAHNAVDGAAYHPGSIIRAHNGKTVYIENTDAEGRLILSDGLARAGQEGADIIVDLATLTGDIITSLGRGLAGMFTDDRVLRDLLLGAGEATGERVWHMPLVREYDHLLNHHLADLQNKNPNEPNGALLAACFLRQFVPAGARWVHLDIPGVANAKAPTRYFAKGATGYGVRLLLEALRLAREGRWPEKEMPKAPEAVKAKKAAPKK